MSTPIETAAEALFGDMPIRVTAGPPLPWKALTDSPTGDVWRGHARAALSSLAQHRDDIVRVLADHEPDQTSYDARDLWGCACGFTTSRSGYDEYDGSRDWAEYHVHVADVVLACLTGEAA